MPVPQTSVNHPDNLDPRFQRIFWEKYNEEPDMIPEIYGVVGHNGRNDMRWSEVGTLPDFTQFTGSVGYASVSEGYDTVLTFIEFAQGFQVERKLMDDDQYNIFDRQPSAMGRSAFRTRQKHAARILNNGFNVDKFFYDNSEGEPLFSNSHTTRSGASTTNGFDNLGTSALSAAAVATARIAMRDFRGDQGERISIIPDTIIHAPSNYEVAYEIIASSGKVDSDENNRNVHEGQYRSVEWQYLDDDNDWFLTDQSQQREMLIWSDRIPLEFAMIEDFDTLTGKWRGYMRYGNAHVDWRFGYGSSV